MLRVSEGHAKPFITVEGLWELMVEEKMKELFTVAVYSAALYAFLLFTAPLWILVSLRREKNRRSARE